MKWDGAQVDLTRADNPTEFAVCVPNFGLLGVTICESNDKMQGLDANVGKISPQDC